MIDYDLSIHQNPDARAWARFFVKTHPGVLNEATMISWFANAMMAMHDHLTAKGGPLNSDYKQYLLDLNWRELVRRLRPELDDAEFDVLWEQWIGEHMAKRQQKVQKVMEEFKAGTLKSGGSGKPVTNRKQAIAIGLSEQRKVNKKR